MEEITMIGVFYVHGFASGINIAKLDNLRKTINDDRCSVIGLHYESNWDFDTIISSLIGQVNQYIDEFDEFVFIGTSLGGLFARELANHYNERMIVINPVTDPYNQLRQFIGINKNYATNQTFEFTEQLLSSYKNYTIKRGGLCLTYVSTQDEVLTHNSDNVSINADLFGKIIYTTTKHQVNFDDLPNFHTEFHTLLNMIAG